MVEFVSTNENTIPSVGLDTIFFTFSQKAPSPNRGIFAYYPVQQMCVIWISSMEPTTFVRSMKSSWVKCSG